MDTRQAYNIWASQDDTNDNKTRDLEARALRQSLTNITFNNCLEVGCGTGKNTEWLIEKAKHITAIDLSDEMLARAKEKITSDKVHFKRVDITSPWTFREQTYDLISFSLVLEHIENLEHIFSEATKSLHPGGYVYIGELHPFKQYAGTKARFDTEAGRHIVECFNHNVSDFVQIPKKHGLTLVDLDEYFDDQNKTLPRILTVILKKSDAP